LRVDVARRDVGLIWGVAVQHYDMLSSWCVCRVPA
jgi:hypothetical protein